MTSNTEYYMKLRESSRPPVGRDRHKPGDASQHFPSAGLQMPTYPTSMPKTYSKSAPQLQEQAGVVRGRNKPLPPPEVERGPQPHGSRHTTVHPPASKYKESSSKPAPARLERRSSVSERTHQSSYSSSQFPRDNERNRYTSSSPTRTHKPAYRARSSSLSTRGPSRDEHDISLSPQAHSKYGRLDVERTRTTSRPTAPSQSAGSDLHERCEAQLTSLEGKLQAQISRVEDKERHISSLEAHIDKLNRSYTEQLSSVRRELGSYQSQLDNVQRFVSTADIHADQDIIQKLQELNEVVYQTSMMMADHVAEGFRRRSATRRLAKMQTSVSAKKFDQTMTSYIAVVEDEDIALSLQIAFQSHLAHFLCRIVSSWTDNQELNILLEGTYQRLRKSETQAISGRWRTLTRAHLQPTSIGDPKILVQETIAGLSDIVMAAGFLTYESQVKEKLSAKFGEKISTIVSHAGKFGNMVAGMVSGDFEVFIVQPGDIFEEERMTDMNEDSGTLRKKGAVQTALCVTRAGLMKRMGEEMMILSKAEVVLRSFLD